MAKSTIDSLEKLLVKFITPINQKFTDVMKELKKLEEKIDKLESIKHQAPNNVGSCSSPAIPVSKPATSTDTGERHQRMRDVKRPTHTLTTPPTLPTIIPEPSVSKRAVAPAVTLCRPLPVKPQAASNPRPVDAKQSHDSNDDNVWHVVEHRSKRPSRRAVVTGKGSTDSELQTVERVRKIHACFFKPETTPESIITYMTKNNPGSVYNADKLVLTHNFYSSFSITVPCSQFNFFMSAENWPPGTEISEWFRCSDGRASGASSQASRRRPSTNARRRPGGNSNITAFGARPFTAATSSNPENHAL